jgi:glycosyltransferase involved in cell wall biosynthesis
VSSEPSPAVTVVIPTRDRWSLLPRALSAALGQEGVDLEVVVVDDGSSQPPPADLAAAAGDRVRLERLPVNRGVSAARNAGVAVARGAWIAFLDDDDLWAPHKLAVQVGELERAGAAWTWCGAWYVDGQGTPASVAAGPTAEQVAAALPSGNVIPAGSSTVVARRDVLGALGGFDETIVHMPDWDLWLRLEAEATAVGCAEPLVAYVQHPAMFSFRDTAAFDRDLAHIDAKLRARGARVTDVEVRRGLYQWMAVSHLRGGARRPAARAWLRSAAVARKPGDLVRGAAALAGPRPARRAERLLARRRTGAGAQAPPLAAPLWLVDYPGFPVDG